MERGHVYYVQRARELARFFYVQRIKGFDPPASPHMDVQTKTWLADRLRSVQLLLEFGCGGSTVLANRLKVRTVSVESDRFYAAAVRRALAAPQFTHFITPAMGLTAEWGMPLFNKGGKGVRYVTAPFARLDRSPDLVLVDGRYRVACTLEAARRTTAPILLDDYAVRSHYHVLERYLGSPKMIGRSALFESRPDVPKAWIQPHLSDPR